MLVSIMMKRRIRKTMKTMKRLMPTMTMIIMMMGRERKNDDDQNGYDDDNNEEENELQFEPSLNPVSFPCPYDVT